MASRLLSPRPRFAYEPGAFSLSYRASNEPQLLDIDLLATGKVFPFPPTIALSAWIEHANQGFGAGAEFAPARTRVEQVSGRRLNDAGDSMGPAYQFGLRVVCVSPFSCATSSTSSLRRARRTMSHTLTLRVLLPSMTHPLRSRPTG